MCSGAAKKHQGCFKFGVRLISSLVLVLWSILSSIAQSVNVELTHFSSAEGLTMPMVNDILLDGEGFMWLAAYGGVAKFDGVTFLNFEPLGMTSKSIKFTCLVEDETGNLWTIGQDTSFEFHLFKFDKAKQQLAPLALDHFPSLPPSIRALLPVKTGEFFMVTQQEEVFYYRQGEITLLFQTPDQLPVRNLQQEADGLVIVGADDSFYKVPMPGNARRESSHVAGGTEQLPSNLPNEFRIGGYVANVISPPRFISATLGLIPRPIFTYDDPVWFYQRQTKPNIHWAFSRKEIHAFVPDRNTWIDLSHLLVDYPKLQGIKCSLIDRYNRIWIGTNDGIFSITAFMPFSKAIFAGKDELGNAFSFRGITKWHGEIFANSYSGKVKFDPAVGTESYFYLLREHGHLLAAHTGATSGFLWMGNSGLLQQFFKADKAPKVYELPSVPGIPQESLEIWSIYEDAAGKVWLGTSVGLAVWNPENRKIKYLSNTDGNHSIGNLKINHILPLQGGLGLATANGFSFYSFEKGFDLTDNRYDALIEQTSGFAIYHALQSGLGDLWLASNGQGLLYWDQGKNTLTQYGIPNGISNINLHAVYADDRGGLWLPSENGLFLFDTKTKVAKETSSTFGFSETEFNRLAHFQDEAGKLYFGGIAGILSFHPSEYYASSKSDSLPLYWQSIQLNEGVGERAVDLTSLIKNSELIPKISGNANLEITLANLGQFDVFEYKWKSEELAWRKATEPQLTLKTLPSRSDELLIRGVGKYGLVSDVLTIPFLIKPENSFQQYMLFLVVFIALSACVTYYFISIRNGKGTLIVSNAGVWGDHAPVCVVAEESEQVADEFETKLDTIIEANISSPEFGVNELSEAFCLSRKSLYRKIKQYTGQNPNEYIRTFRLEYARKLLAEADLNISDVTFKAGFSSSSYFSNCYKKHFGLSPKEDRKRLNVD